MKRFSILIALLLALSPVASALTAEGPDLYGTPFQWGAYTLELSLFTDDPAQLDYAPSPAEGQMVMVRLTSTGGQIALQDIEANARSIYLMAGAEGAMLPPLEWHAPGTKEVQGAKALNDWQDSFELIYYLPQDVQLPGASLLLVDPDGFPYTAFITPLDVAETAPEETAQPEPTPEPTPEQLAADFLNQLLSGRAQKESDPWTQAILEAGAQNVTIEGGALKFSLRSFNPGLKSITETEPGDSVRHLCRNASAYDIAYSLPVTTEGGYAAKDADVGALVKAARKAAAQSKKAFNDKNVRVQLSGYLLSGSAVTDMGWDWIAGEITPLFAAQSKQALDVSAGPHALKLTTTGVNGDDLLRKGYQAALQILARQQGANQLSDDEIERAFRDALTAQASAMKKKGAEKSEFELDVDDLSGSDLFSDFVSNYDDAYGSQLYALQSDVSSLPDYPAQDFPKSGRVSGSTSGTKVIFKSPKGGPARLLQMRSTDTGELKVTAFLRPGESATVRVPKGQYYILIASGAVWYGDEHLFGDSGSYARTEDIQIKGGNYYHVITLGGVEDGNMSSYGADPSEFQ